MDTTMKLYALANLFFCAGIAWSCMCRLNLIQTRHPHRVLARYALLMTGALTYGFAPMLFDEWPGKGGLLFSATVFGTLLLSLRHRLGPNEHPRTRSSDGQAKT